jgi:hypothetical protein
MFTLRRQIELETIFLITICAGISIFFVTQKNNFQPQFSIASNEPQAQAPAEVVTPKITVFSQISPDGKEKVIMKVTENNDGTKTYAFSTANQEGDNEKHIFSKTSDLQIDMTIPFNTWSPDNKYFFIQENSENGKSIFVFSATGTQFANGEIYLDATDLFAKANTGNNFNQATGWASESLIIINTTKENNAEGPSYWFEVPSKAIIQLSTKF